MPKKISGSQKFSRKKTEIFSLIAEIFQKKHLQKGKVLDQLNKIFPQNFLRLISKFPSFSINFQPFKIRNFLVFFYSVCCRYVIILFLYPVVYIFI